MAERLSYFELLKHPNWQRKRLAILERANFHCEDCGSGNDTLHVHHSYYERGLKPWEYPDESLHCLCETCHRKAQDRLAVLHRQIGKLDLSQIDELIGYAMALESSSFPMVPLDVFSYEVAAGIGSFWGMRPDKVIDSLDDGVVDGYRLQAVSKEAPASAALEVQTPEVKKPDDSSDWLLIPPRFAKCSFDNLILYPNDRLIAAVKRARQFAKTFPNVDRGLCLIGPPGIGKTHLATAILIHVLTEHRGNTHWWDQGELSRACSSATKVNRETIISCLVEGTDPDVLLIDDLGSRDLSRWVKVIIERRLSARRPTIFTTNYENLPEGPGLTLKTVLGASLHSLMSETCEFVEYDGGDFRRMPSGGGQADLIALWKESARLWKESAQRKQQPT